MSKALRPASPHRRRSAAPRSCLALAAAAALGSLSAPALAAEPASGVEVTLRRGFFTETNVGGFFTLGGNDGYSNLQTYVQLGGGYQLRLNQDRSLVPFGVHVGIGANAQNCFAGRTSGGGACALADNFTLTFVGGSAGYLHRVIDRLFVGAKLLGGWTFLEPGPVKVAGGAPGKVIDQAAHVGAAASVEYATLMDHFSVGLDVAVRLFFMGPGNTAGAVSVFPRVQYTF